MITVRHTIPIFKGVLVMVPEKRSRLSPELRKAGQAAQEFPHGWHGSELLGEVRVVG